jgi:hypothetical protein
VGIEENVFQIGKSSTFNAAPWLDETAAAALRLSERGLEPVVSLARTLRGVSSFALDFINPRREEERPAQEHLKKRVGQILLVGGYEDMEPLAAERTADSLWATGVVDAGTIVGIRPLVHREPTKQQLKLQQSAELLHAALKGSYKVASNLAAPEDPVRIPGEQLRPAPLYEAIRHADADFVNWLDDRLKEHWEGEDVAPRSRTLIVVNPELSPHIKGVRYQDLANGGLAMLAAARRRGNYRWLPVKRAPALAAPVVQEEPAVTHGELELDFELPKSERFKRSGDDSEAMRQARERQTALAEG